MLAKTIDTVILTGAGISAESGIQTFRGGDGLWEGYHIEEVATPQAFQRNPELVYRFYNMRRAAIQEAHIAPNAAHLALAELEKKHPEKTLLVTQNVDHLHEQAGHKNVWHMHGELLKARCQSCSEVLEWFSDLTSDDSCPQCQKTHSLRPHIVWFGEMPFYLDEIAEALAHCKTFIAIGTSSVVYPAAGFVDLAPQAHKIEVNLTRTDRSGVYDEHLIGPASQTVPELVKRLL